jgi:cell division protein FtsN
VTIVKPTTAGKAPKKSQVCRCLFALLPHVFKASILAGSIKRKSGEQEKHNETKHLKTDEEPVAEVVPEPSPSKPVAEDKTSENAKVPVVTAPARGLPLGDYGSGSDEE